MRSLSLRQPWGLALQNLLQDTLRPALSVVGIALALIDGHVKAASSTASATSSGGAAS